ncbi:uncharacterized protein LOC130718117 [Lotus japonicus]|uniref:uncharacterized protein LOC130718117 n=1 Tax=Lotus japonicus TaxID=34305 RepID=UPI00258601A4|nr:uncharacterized protein LOC130718117 [Lotus japonicus]
MELILIDAKGDKIHGTVRRTHVYKFNPLLVEGRVYMLSYFTVGDNVLDFRTTSHPHKIIFELDSVVQTQTDVSITKIPYSFVYVSDIMFTDPYQILCDRDPLRPWRRAGIRKKSSSAKEDYHRD